MEPQVVRYSERPDLWDSIRGLTDEVWPEYNQHGETVLAEGHTVPLAWDGTDADLGPGIDATIASAFELRERGGRPTAVSALAAEIPPRHQGRHLSGVLLTAMAGLARNPGRTCNSRRAATTCSPPALPPCASTAPATAASTGNPTSG
jgi:hypothetical protein